MKTLTKLGVGAVMFVAASLGSGKKVGEIREARAAEDLNLATLQAMTDRLMKGVSDERREDVASEAYLIASQAKPLWKDDASGMRTARFLVVFTAYESMGHATAIGDGGEAWGATQIHWRLWGPLLESWGSIGSIYDLFEMRLAMHSTVAIMRYLTKACGSVKKAAYAYASGTCAGTITGRTKSMRGAQ